MSKLTDFVFQHSPPTLIVNQFSDNNLGSTINIMESVGKKILSGLTLSGVAKLILSVVGSGSLSFVGVSTLDATTRTIGLVLVVDGVTIFNHTSSPIGVTNRGIFAIGAYNGANSSVGHPVYFNSYFSVYVSSSVEETDKIAALVNYEVY